MIDINELRMMVHDFKRVGSPRLLLQTTQMGELLDRLEVAEKERDALRSLVVMRFDHDHPPQFVQGYDPHDLLEPVTAEHCRWFVAEIERLRAKIEAMEKQEPFDADSDVFRGAFEAALKAGNWPATRQGDGYRSPSTQIAWRIAFSTVNRLKLYLAPVAQGE